MSNSSSNPMLFNPDPYRDSTLDENLNETKKALSTSESAKKNERSDNSIDSSASTDTQFADDNHALFKGEAVQLPLDLFIPPDALEIWIETYEGPLDLLLHLIRKNNFDILDIPISEVTDQYMEYIDYLEEHRFELASEYLVMAAWLAEIKSRILLPRPVEEEDDEDDPRLELIKKLQIYTLYKEAALELSDMPRYHATLSSVEPDLPPFDNTIPPPAVDLDDLVNALKNLLKRVSLQESHTVTQEKISVEDRMASIAQHIHERKHCLFTDLFNLNEGRYGITISFLAILELTRQQLIKITQDDAYSEIFLSQS